MEDTNLQAYQIEELKLTKLDHEIRIKELEVSKLLNKEEMATFRQSLSEQKILILDLDRTSKEQSLRQFDKMQATQDKMTETQGKLLEKILDNQHDNNIGKFEVTKAKLGVILGSCSSVIGIVMYLLQHFLG